MYAYAHCTFLFIQPPLMLFLCSQNNAHRTMYTVKVACMRGQVQVYNYKYTACVGACACARVYTALAKLTRN